MRGGGSLAHIPGNHSEDELSGCMTYESRNSPPPIKLEMDRGEAAKLYVVLTDNARAWNSKLREQLNQQVSPTDAYNARLELAGRIRK